MAGLIEACPGAGSGTPYAVTEWGRTGIRPLVAAGRCERVHMGSRAAPVTKIDAEAALLLATPLLDLPEEASGACQLEVEVARGRRNQAAIRVEVEGGKVVACDCAPEEKASTYAAGTTSKWFTAIREGTFEGLRFGGGEDFAESVVRGLHLTLTRS
jgi:hypothetical protein